MTIYEAYDKAALYAQRISCPNDNPDMKIILAADYEYLIRQLEPVVEVYNFLKQICIHDTMHNISRECKLNNAMTQ